MRISDLADNSKRNFIQQEPIAIIGIGCRYSGDINNLDDFWKVLIEKKSTLENIPDERISDESIYDEERGFRKIVTKQGGWLKNLKEFDAKFFNISPREAEKVDPHQRIMLEVTYEAFEDAGLKLEDVWGTRTGVYAGMWSSDFEHVLSNSGDDIDVYSTTGSGRYAAAGRLAYYFNLQGPTFTIDTACSTSLVAIHLAGQSLHLKECDLAVCSAANLLLSPFISIGYSRSRLLSDYGKCRFGAKDPGGYVRTEGAATVILKRLSDAQRDGDFIYGIVPGSACNSDGQSNKHMLAPSAITQEIMIKDALNRARLKPKDIQYVEAHGTGTKAGDPVEISSISEALNEGRSPEDVFYVGSIKTNLGHTEAASGMAGLLKVILSIQNRIIPANIYADEERNPNIPWEELLLEIPAEATPWPKPDQPLTAGLNSFGISGTNGHLIIQEAPKREAKSIGVERKYNILPISAANEKALQEYCKLYLPLFEKTNDWAELLNLVKNISIRKADLSFRTAIIFENKEDIIDALKKIIDGKSADNIISGYNEEKKRTAFVFPGQGAQWRGMGRALYQSEPAFRKSIDKFSTACEKYTSWSVKDKILNSEEWADIDVIQPVLLAVEIALAEWWKSIGLDFKAVIGHSMGEVGAAYISGAISLEDAAAIICTRSQLMKRTSGQGAMAYIALPPDEVEKQFAGIEREISIGVQNSPSSCVISGSPSAVNKVCEYFEDQEAFVRKVKVDVASHSYQMQPLMDELGKSLEGIQTKSTNTEFFSSVKADALDSSTLTADYWTENLRNTVQFASAIQKMIAEGYGHFVEVSPHPTLLQPIRENAEFMQTEVSVSGSLEREKDEQYTLIYQTAQYYAQGGRISWKKFYDLNFNKVLLPAYPWQRIKYWVEENVLARNLSGGMPVSNQPFLSGQVDVSGTDDIYILETEIGLKEFPYLKDHKIQDTVVFPAAGYIEIIWEAVNEIFGAGRHLIQNVRLENALPLEDNHSALIQILLTKEIADNYSVKISSLNNKEDTHSWTVHATAEVFLNVSSHRLLSDLIDVENAKDILDSNLSADDEPHYINTEAINLPYGPAFQTVKKLAEKDNLIMAEISAGQSLEKSLAKYYVHPAVLDGFIQVFLSTIYTKSSRGTFVPVSAGEILLHQYEKNISGGTMILQTELIGKDTIKGSATVFDQSGEVVLELKNFVLERLEKEYSDEEKLKDILYETVGIETDLPELKNKKVLLFAADDLAEDFIEKLQPVFIVRKGRVYNQAGNEFEIDVTEYDHYTQLTESVKGNFDTIVHTWNTDEKSVAGLEPQENTTLSLVRILQSLTKSEIQARLWVVTNLSEKFPAQSTALGMLNVVRNELPEFNASSIQISGSQYLKAIPILKSDTEENSWIINEDVVTVERLKPITIERPSEEVPEVRRALAENQPFEVITNEPGLLSNLTIRKKHLPRLSANHARIKVKAVGINFMNLMSALGIYPGKKNGFATLGIECAGVVEEIGSEVTNLKPGDRIFGMAYHTMSSHVDVNASLMQPIPDNLSFEEAATIPVVFLTAYYGLIELANLQEGERVLIHSATGGVGLAAIQLAQFVGAEIYATAGNEEKREHLRALGISHIYDSRSLDFADQILSDTSGEGVDVVLNSLTGSAMKKSLELLRDFGRFVEIGKKDVYENSKIGLEVFSKGLSYFMIDFEKMIFERPQFVGEILGELLDYFENETFKPLPGRLFHISKAEEAFEYMTKSRHIGKIVVKVDSEEVYVEDTSKNTFDSDATYLITGGYGGLGLTFSQYLIDKGVRRLILTGRSGQSTHPKIKEWQSEGIEVILKKADVSEREDLESVLQSTSDEDKPLKGIFHLAGILEDASILNLDEDAYYRVLSPKVLGAYNLHILSQAYELKHFVLFSSSTVLFGSPGQAAYVAANHYMDALIKYRERLGLTGTAVQWGTVSDIGLAASADNRSNRLEEEGISPLTPEETTTIFDLTQTLDQNVIGAFRFDLRKWQDTYPSVIKNHFYDILRETISEVPGEEKDGKKSLKDILFEITDLELRQSALEEQLKEIVGKVVKLQAEDIHVKTTFKSLGIDSLMSIQLKNQLEKQYETGLSVTAFWTYSNIKDYARFLLEKIHLHEVSQSEETEKTLSENIVESETDIEKEIPQPEIKTEDTKSETTEVSETDIESGDLSIDELSRLLDDELDGLLDD